MLECRRGVQKSERHLGELQQTAEAGEGSLSNVHFSHPGLENAFATVQRCEHAGVTEHIQGRRHRRKRVSVSLCQRVKHPKAEAQSRCTILIRCKDHQKNPSALWSPYSPSILHFRKCFVEQNILVSIKRWGFILNGLQSPVSIWCYSKPVVHRFSVNISEYGNSSSSRASAVRTVHGKF